MTPLIFIRPQPGCDASMTAAKKIGLDAHGFPLFVVRPQPWDIPEPDTFDALLIGSANALRHGGAGLKTYQGKPVYAVGQKTAQACRDAGLDLVATGEGGLQDLLAKLKPEHTRLLRLSGAQRVELNPPTGITIAEPVVYSSNSVPMPEALAELLRHPAVVALHSAQAARHFRAQCEEQKIALSRITLAVIGPRVAEAAGQGWQAVHIAKKPSDEALLAMARQICEEPTGPQKTKQVSKQKPMQDQSGIKSLGQPQRPGRPLRVQIALVVLAFALGAAAVTWSAWRGYLNGFIPDAAPVSDAAEETPAGLVQTEETAESDQAEDSQMQSVSTAEARLAMLEDRFSRLNLQANAASGNAARAESLLIAFAARRMIDRGEPLRYLADQLQLRFANAQPRAVRIIVEFAKRPVTSDELSTRLEALGPQLAGGGDKVSFWESAKQDLSSLFTVRREPSSLVSTEARLERARVMLRIGRIPEAIGEVKGLPGAKSAAIWIRDAQRYADVQQALDLLETAAMLEPTLLHDSEGNTVDQPSPLAAPTDTPDAKKAP